MRQWRNTYMGFSISCAIVWAVLLLAVTTRGDSATAHNVSLVGAGWWIGWLAATIARAVYPR